MEIIADRGLDADVTEYLKAPPERATLERIISLLDEEPSALVRHDKRFKELGLAPADYVTAAAVVELLLAHPELMERPVVIVGDRAVIARPPEKLLGLLG